MTSATKLDSSCLEACMVGHALDGMCVAMVLTNAAGRVSWMNRSAQRILGIDKQESEGELLSQILRDPTMAEFWHRTSATDDVVMGELTLKWPKTREIKINASRCLDAGGECIGRALLFCDVTDDRLVHLQLTQEATQKLLDIADQWQPAAGNGTPKAGLTAQELRILRLVGGGFGNQEIARELHVAPSTVRTHLKHLYGKLGLTSRSEAISYALRNGLV
jgi:DNA-binding CsgD family transcriptional regulator